MKVCVYTICKNEIDNINQWLDCMNEADYMVVVDTGSIDGTYEKLREAQRKYKNLLIYKENINPWRFDVARNVAKSHIPADTDLCVSMDMDEIFMYKGWCSFLKRIWLPNYELGTLFYIDNKENNVYNKRTMLPRTKIHKLSAIWKYPLHEVPLTDINDEYCAQSLISNNHMQAVNLDLRDNDWERLIVIHNSTKKAKESYIQLAELRLTEYPGIVSETIKIMELFKNQKYQDCYNFIDTILKKYADNDQVNHYKSKFYFYKGYIEENYFKKVSLAKDSFETSVSYNSKNYNSIYELVLIYNARKLNNKIINLLKPTLDNFYDDRFSRYGKPYDELMNWFYDNFENYYNMSK